MRISDWSSDVCSSDLPARSRRQVHAEVGGERIGVEHVAENDVGALAAVDRVGSRRGAIGRAAENLKHVRELFGRGRVGRAAGRSEAHTSDLSSLMRTSYAVFCFKKKKYR